MALTPSSSGSGSVGGPSATVSSTLARHSGQVVTAQPLRSVCAKLVRFIIHESMHLSHAAWLHGFIAKESSLPAATPGGLPARAPRRCAGGVFRHVDALEATRPRPAPIPDAEEAVDTASDGIPDATDPDQGAGLVYRLRPASPAAARNRRLPAYLGQREQLSAARHAALVLPDG